MNRILSRSLPYIIQCLLLLIFVASAIAEYPERPITLVVPFGTGGGTDTYARALQQAIDDHDLLPQPIVISNVPGAGATIGSRQEKNGGPDGYTLLLLHEAIITAQHSGQAKYGPEAFEPIAGTGRIGLILAVAEKSPHKDLTDLLEDAKQRPDQLVFAANIGAPVHFVGAMLEQHYPGARFRFTQTGGGEKRLNALLGRHAEVSAFSLEEFLRYESAGIRALAYCDKHRTPDAPNIPTTFEQGIPIRHINMQFWWAPKGTPKERTAVFAAALEKAMQNEDVIERMKQIHSEPVFVQGEAMQAEVAALQESVSGVVLRETQPLPNIPLFVGLLTAMLGAIVGVQTLRSSTTRTTPVASSLYSLRAALAFVVITVSYGAVLALKSVGFAEATFVYVLIVGAMLTRMQRKHWIPLIVVAVAMSWGMGAIFTNFFKLVLP